MKQGKQKIIKNLIGLLMAALLLSHCQLDGTTGGNGSSSPASGGGSSNTGAAWYVDPAAPPGGDGTKSSPFNSVTMAIYPNNPAWMPGDDLVLMAGDYNDPISIDFSAFGDVEPAISGDPMVITAEPGVFLHSYLWIKNAKWLQLKNLTFYDVYGYALVIDASSNIDIISPYIKEVYNQNTNPDPTQNQMAHGIVINQSTIVSVKDGYLRDIDYVGIKVTGSRGVYIYNTPVVSAGDTGYLVESSTEVNLEKAFSAWCWIGLQLRGMVDLVNVYYSAFVYNSFAGIAATLPQEYEHSQSPVVLERILAASNTIGMYFDGASDTKVQNVTIAYNQSAGVVLGNSQGVSIDSSIIAFSNDGVADYSGSSSGVTVTYSDLYGNQNDVVNLPQPENSISEDPEFVDPGSMDYSLKENSPCIDAGNPGVTPPEGGGDTVDMGALEYVQNTD